MAGKPGRRRWMVTAVVVLAPSIMAGAPAGAAPMKSAPSPTLARTAHAAFWECPSTTTLLRVAVNTLTLHPGATLDISFTVRNGATTPCNYTAPYAGVVPGPTSTTLTAGPCGAVSFQIDDAHHHNVWPGNDVVNCPALGVAQLAAGATVSGTGSWDQTTPNGTHRMRPGTYTLVVENRHFSFPLRVDKS